MLYYKIIALNPANNECLKSFLWFVDKILHKPNIKNMLKIKGGLMEKGLVLQLVPGWKRQTNINKVREGHWEAFSKDSHRLVCSKTIFVSHLPIFFLI